MKSAMATVRLLGWSVWEKCWNCCQSLKRWDTHTHTDVFFLSDPSFCTHEGEETEGTPRRSLSALIGRFLHVPADSGAQVSAELLLSYSDLCCVQLSLQVSEIRIKPLWSFFFNISDIHARSMKQFYTENASTVCTVSPLHSLKYCTKTVHFCSTCTCILTTLNINTFTGCTVVTLNFWKHDALVWNSVG